MLLHQLAQEQSNTLFNDLCSNLNVSKTSQSGTSSQIICLRERIDFANKIEEIFTKRNSTLLTLKETIVLQIKHLASRTATTSNPLQQRKDQALILQTVYHRDIADRLVNSRSRQSSDWVWLSQLRYSCDGKSCDIRCCDAVFHYSFEYQGNEEMLVQTALTDKCYLNLTQAMRFGFGGNPFGPAGTGKLQRFVVFFVQLCTSLFVL